MTPGGLSTVELVNRLRAWADGYHPLVAAVDLLTAHQVWLNDARFLAHITLGKSVFQRGPLASINGEQLLHSLRGGELRFGDPSDRAVLAVAASLVGGGPVDLRDIALTCTPADLDKIAAAVRRAGGR